MLRSGKVAGICGIPADLLRAGGEPKTWRLHAILAAIPHDLLKSLVIPLWMGIGDQWDCSNLQGITLRLPE